MKNVVGRTFNDDLIFVKKAIDGSSGVAKKFLTGPRVAVENAIINYQTSIAGNTAAPVGLAKGQPKIKGKKGKKANGVQPAVPAIPAQPAIPDAHEYYYALYDSGRQFIALELKRLTLNYFGHICPYCGVDTVSHIDHYLPRCDFPEFSISLQNLIMSCDGCNSKYKRDLWGNGMKKKIFHPALDPLPAAIFLTADCKYVSGAISVNFSIAPGWQNTLFDRHFELMNLNERYIAKATLEETPKMKKIIDSEISQDKKVHALKVFVAQQIIAHDKNSCQGAFYSALQPLADQIALGGL